MPMHEDHTNNLPQCGGVQFTTKFGHIQNTFTSMC